MSHNYSTLLLPNLILEIEKSAPAELAPLLGKTEVDAQVAGVVKAIHEVMYTMFAIGHIISPDQILERAKYFFRVPKQRSIQPRKLTNDILAKHVPEKLDKEQIVAVTHWVKCKIMELMYASFFQKLRMELVGVSNNVDGPIHPWNLESFKVGKWQTLRDFIRTTVAPENPEKWFCEHMSAGVSQQFMAAFRPGMKPRAQKSIYRNNGVSLKRDNTTSLLDKAASIPVVGDLAEQARIKDFVEKGPPVLAELTRQDFLAANVRSGPRVITKQSRTLTAITGIENMDDAMQDGFTGLDTAFRKLNPSMGFKFSTYSSAWIRQSVVRAAEQTGRTIRLPSHLSSLTRTLFGEMARFRAKYGKEPSNAELAALIYVPEQHVEYLRRFIKKPVSLDSSSDPDHPDKKLSDIIPSKSETDAAVLEADNSDHLNALFEGYLSSRDAKILRMRFGIMGTETLENKAGTSVAELEKAIAKMKDSAGKYSIEVTGGELHVRLNPELIDIMDFAGQAGATLLDLRLVYTLNIPEARKHVAYYAVKSQGLSEKIKLHTDGDKQEFSIDPRDAEVSAKARGIVGDFLKHWPELSIHAIAVLEPQGEETIEDLESRIKGEFGEAVTETKPCITRTITLEVFDKMSFDHLATVVGISRERVRQIVKESLKRLKCHINDKTPSEYAPRKEDADGETGGREG